jgi:RHS repeat-associated protein
MLPPDIELTFRDGGTGDAGDPYTGLDRFGRLVETLWKQDTEERARSAYGRNRVGGVVWRRDDEAHAQSPEVDTEDNYYGYDGLQQIKERQRGNLTGTAPDYTGIDNLQQEEDWSYDATGNWTKYSNPSTAPGDTQTRTHNAANEITEISATAGDVEPEYDAAGNMLRLPKEPGGSTDEYNLVCDAWNRLVAVKDGSTLVARYTYDGLTRRLTKANATETRHYYYNTDWRVLEERVEGATHLLDRQFVWGLRDRWDLLRRKRSVSGDLDEALYVLKDYLDPVAIVDDSGNVVERYAYDAFGNVRFLAPDYSSISDSAFDWDFLFHAEFCDSGTKVYNYGYRYYSKGLGRWLSRDPLAEAFLAESDSQLLDRTTTELNKYCAFGNSPIGTRDLLGLLTSADVSLKIKFGKWTDNGSEINMNVEFEVKIKCSENKIYIRQFKEGEVTYSGKKEISPPNTVDSYIWNVGQPKWGISTNTDWKNCDKMRCATWKDAPGFRSLTADSFPVYFGGQGRKGHFKFVTEVRDSDTNEVLQSITWGELINYKSPNVGVKYFYK